MVTKVSKWGNSLGLRLSKSIIQSLNLKDGSEISITEEGGRIILEPKSRDLTMDELLKGMDSKGILKQYTEVESVGKEQFWNDEEK